MIWWYDEDFHINHVGHRQLAIVAGPETDSLRWKIPWKIHENLENEGSMILNPEMMKFAPYFLETLSNTLWGLVIHAPFFALCKLILVLLESSQWFPKISQFTNVENHDSLNSAWVKFWVKTQKLPCTSRQNYVFFFNQDVVPTHP